MTSLDTIVTHLRHAVDHLHQAVTQVRGARDMAEELRDLFDQLGIRDLVERMQAVIDRAEDLERMLLAGVDAGEQLIAQTEAVRHGGGSGGAAVPGPTAPTGPTTAQPKPVTAKAPVTPGWRPRHAGEVPEHVREAGRRLRPRAPGDNRFTAGVMDGEMIYSGGKDTSIADDLDYASMRWPPVTYYQHVESKVAARMRNERLMHAEVTIDNTVCGTNPRDRGAPLACETVLPGILPAGSRLVAWVPCDGGRSFWRRTYHGTGERIRG